ncbi:MAG: hypothetical protein GY757_38455, partial [bacterium]|nr:hypothetical protein [bacterium]
MNSQIMFKERGIELKSLKLSDNEFNRMKGIVFDSTGISLGDSKRALLVSRLSRRLRQLNMSSFQLYIHRLQNDTGEILRMVNYVTTNLTRFNREKVQF